MSVRHLQRAADPCASEPAHHHEPLAAPLVAQSFETAASQPGDPRFHQPDYPLVFVATQGHGNPVNDTPPHFGLDVHAVSNPSAHGPAAGCTCCCRMARWRSSSPCRCTRACPD